MKEPHRGEPKVVVTENYRIVNLSCEKEMCASILKASNAVGNREKTYYKEANLP